MRLRKRRQGRRIFEYCPLVVTTFLDKLATRVLRIGWSHYLESLAGSELLGRHSTRNSLDFLRPALSHSECVQELKADWTKNLDQHSYILGNKPRPWLRA